MKQLALFEPDPEDEIPLDHFSHLLNEPQIFHCDLSYHTTSVTPTTFYVMPVSPGKYAVTTTIRCRGHAFSNYGDTYHLRLSCYGRYSTPLTNRVQQVTNVYGPSQFNTMISEECDMPEGGEIHLAAWVSPGSGSFEIDSVDLMLHQM